MNLNEVNSVIINVAKIGSEAERNRRLLKTQCTLMPLGFYWANHEGNSGVMILSTCTPIQDLLGGNETLRSDFSTRLNYFEKNTVGLPANQIADLAQLFMKIPHAMEPGQFETEVSDFLLLTLGWSPEDPDEIAPLQKDTPFEEWLAAVKHWCYMARAYQDDNIKTLKYEQV